ncbi:Gfo/Idh/MocA family protein [Halobacillus sp. H74]|uniref:Gfo/Idh/MocA family protein n=1 Tax=Halobacillus sp. H74 TaxID=3457436 RepID=UPI003FCD6015
MANTKVAIIGGGQVAETKHIPSYLEIEGVEIVAVLNSNKENARQFALKNNIPGYYGDIHELLKKEKPDLVSVCTPNKFHYEHVTSALEAGCHVLCEKPPSILAQDAKEVMELAERKGLILSYNFQHRFSLEARRLREEYCQGRLGDVYHVNLSALRRSGVPGWGSFINKDLQGGGPLIDIGIHMLDTAFYILGFPKVHKVTGKMFKKIGPYKSEGSFGQWDPEKYEVEDSFFGFIELSNGGLIQISTSFALNIKETKQLNAEFHGDQAGATLYPLEIYTDHKGEFVTLVDEEMVEDQAERRAIHSFVRTCRGSAEEVIASGEEGYRIQTLIESLYKSAELGESIYI